jgi:hypothetical protein
MGQGTPIAQTASSSVASAAQGQGYTSAGNLGPGGAGDSQTSLANIGQAIADLAAQANPRGASPSTTAQEVRRAKC